MFRNICSGVHTGERLFMRVTEKMARSVRALQNKPEIGGLEGRRDNGDDLLLVAGERYRLPRLVFPDDKTIVIEPFEAVVKLLTAGTEIGNFGLDTQQIVLLAGAQGGHAQVINPSLLFQLAVNRPAVDRNHRHRADGEQSKNEKQKADKHRTWLV